MSSIQSEQLALRKPLRLWPGVAIVIVQWFVRFLLPAIVPKATIFGMPVMIVAVIGGVVGGLAIIIWWLFFSRASWSERLGVLAFIIIAVFATSRIVDRSIADGMMGMMLPIFAIPVLSLGLVAAAAITRRSSNLARRLSIITAIVLACGVFLFLRTGGITGEGNSDFHWRWTATPEERLLAESADEKAAPDSLPPSSGVEGGTDWSGFRGPDRNSVVRGPQIATDWSASPPVELWRRPIGPGWSSFAVRGDLFYTQEQRGKDEVVACYRLSTGQPVWAHRDAARFYESNGGPGPRGTPTLSGGHLYSLGATGILNALNADNGSVVWSRNAASDTKKKLPGWGFSSSPLIVGDEVVVATAGTLAAYDLASGEPRWVGPEGGGGYSSPHRVTLAGVEQILLLSGTGVTSVAPGDGKVLWQHVLQSGTPIVQPALTVDGDLLVSNGEGTDMRRLLVAQRDGAWAIEERWTSFELTPNFNDFVVHKGYAYGFDGGGLVCIDVKDGARKWDGGNYGYGQLILLAEQDVLLVVSEKGEVALVKATPDQFTEVARFSAIKGKTWNHPVLAGDVLLVRNGEEMTALRLARQSK
jgi:outer membrane protein assembly factor BamB